MLSNSLPSVQKNEYNIAIVGVGEGGTHNVNCMIDSGVWNVSFITVHGYSMDMEKSKANTRIFIGENMPKGLGMIANHEICERLAIEKKKL